MKYRIDHSKVIKQANSISNNADRFNAQIKELTRLEQECRVCWKGEAADTFIAKLNDLKSEMTKTKKQISNLAETIRYCADRIKKEDDEANKRAASLGSGGSAGGR